MHNFIKNINKHSLKLIYVALIFSLLPGCAATKKKFTRHSEFKPVERQMLNQKEFVKPYSNSYYYSEHFNMWKLWHSELIRDLDGNAKKAKRASDEILSHLNQMKSYLIDSKAAELQEEIDDISWAIDFNSVRRGSSRIRFTLERADRVLRSKYTSEDMKEFIKSDEIEL
ncbi:MAG: hypothetical protein ACI9CF_000042 [Candidatus Omnitrophota bacterium]|jgi:hypothetical protein